MAWYHTAYLQALAEGLGIEAVTEASLEQILLAFDPARHGGEAMVDAPVGAEEVG